MFRVYLIITLALFEYSYVPGACDPELDEALRVYWTGFGNPDLLCPAESKQDIKKLEKFSTRYSYLLRYCLFRKTFQQNEEELCPFEMKPVFKPHADEETEKKIECGFGSNRVLHYFGYFYCGSMDASLTQLRTVRNSKELDKYAQRFVPKDIPMYDVCYDMADFETVHTTHRIWQPLIYQKPGFQEQSYSPTEISTDPFYMKQKRIFKMKKFYEKQKKEDPKTRYRMLPHPMVPPQHFTLRTLKRTTNHYINMAPLWEDLIPLMNVIDEGIKIAALKVYKPPVNNEEEESEELLIFTKVVKLPKRKYDQASKKWYQIKSPTYQPNIWYKFLYNEKKKQGLIIYIHNDPEGPSETECALNKIVQCNFHTWWTSPENPSESSTKQIDFKYAYCCQITKEKANDLFYWNFTIEDILDIDSIITHEKSDA